MVRKVKPTGAVSEPVQSAGGTSWGSLALTPVFWLERLLRKLCLVIALIIAFMLGAVFEMKQLKTFGTNGLEPLSWEPRIFLSREFLTSKEAAYIIKLAQEESSLKQSGTGDGEIDSRRTSSTAWLNTKLANSKLSGILDRMHALARLPRSHGEVLAVTRYEPGQLYSWHHDSDMRARRLATVLVYLDVPEAGGETLFPFAADQMISAPPFDRSGGRGPGAETPFEEYCTGQRGGLRITPRAGDAVLFFSHKASNEIDIDAWHASCPVRSGTKWIAQLWIKSITMADYIQETYNMTETEFNVISQLAAQKRKNAKSRDKAATASVDL